MVNIGQEITAAAAYEEARAAVATFEEATKYLTSTCQRARARKYDPATMPIYEWYEAFRYPHPASHTSSTPPSGMGIPATSWYYMTEQQRVAVLAKVWPHPPFVPAEPPPAPAHAFVFAPPPIPAPIPAPIPVPALPIPPPPAITATVPAPELMPQAPPGLPWRVGTYEEAEGLIRTGCGGGFTVPNMVKKWYGWTTEERHAAGMPPLYIPTYNWEAVFGYPHEKAYLSAMHPSGVKAADWKGFTHQQRRDILAFPIELRPEIVERWKQQAAAAPPAAPEVVRAFVAAAAPPPALPAMIAPPPVPIPAPTPVTVTPVPAPGAVAPVPRQIEPIVRPTGVPTVKPFVAPTAAPYLPHVIPLPLPPAPRHVPPPPIHLPPHVALEAERPHWAFYVLLSAMLYYGLIEARE